MMTCHSDVIFLWLTVAQFTHIRYNIVLTESHKEVRRFIRFQNSNTRVESPDKILHGYFLFYMSKKTRLKAKEAISLYRSFSPESKDYKINLVSVDSGHVINTLKETSLSESFILMDTVLVRYDGIIFRNYKQVYPEVNYE